MDDITRINTLIEEFRQQTEDKQGYIHLNFWDGIKSGDIVGRASPTGAPEFGHAFKSIPDLILKLEELKDRIIVYGAKYFQ